MIKLPFSKEFTKFRRLFSAFNSLSHIPSLNKYCSIFQCKNSLTMLLIIFSFSFIFITWCPNINTCSISGIILPISNILISIGKYMNTISMFLSFFKTSFIFSTTSINDRSFSLNFSIYYYSLIYVAISCSSNLSITKISWKCLCYRCYMIRSYIFRFSLNNIIVFFNKTSEILILLIHYLIKLFLINKL